MALQSGADDKLSRATTLDLLGNVLAARGDKEQAERLYTESFELRRQLPTASRPVADSLAHRGHILLLKGDQSGRSDIEKATAIYQGLYSARPTALIGPFRGLARGAVRRGEFEQADRILQQVVTQSATDPSLLRDLIATKQGLLQSHPHDADLLLAQGELFGRVGQFAQAEQAFRRAITVGPPESRLALLWHECLPLLLENNDADQFQRQRHEALARFRNSPDSSILHRIAKSSLCYPLTGEDLATAVSMADAALAHDPSSRFYLQSKGMAEFRKGNFRAAMSALSGSDDHSYAYRDIVAEFYISMAAAALDDRTTATDAYKRGVDLWNTYAPKPGSDDLLYFQDWALCHLAYVEAQTTVGRALNLERLKETQRP
jgi:Flp pilus assembly protein TadD